MSINKTSLIFHGVLAIHLVISILVNNSVAIEFEFPHGLPPKLPLVDVQGGPMSAVALMPDASFLNIPDVFGEPLPNQPGYLDILTAYDKTTDGKYYLLKSEEGNWGWMKSDEILTSSVCLRSGRKNNPAYLKVIFKNNRQLQEGLIEQVPIRKGPGENYDVVGKINLHQIRYAFKKVKGKDGNSYIFVGCEPTWEPDRKWVRNTLTGWVLREHCILWDNQMGVYFDKATLPYRDPVLVFRTQHDLIKYMETGVASNVIGVEDNEVNIKLSPDTTRFPILDYQNGMIEVAWIGDWMNSFIRKDLLPKQKLRGTIEVSRGDTNQYVDKVRMVDVLLLIDGSIAMGQCLQPLSDGVQNFLNGLNDTDRKRFQFALGLYVNNRNELGNRGFKLVSDFGEKEIHHAISKVESLVLDYKSFRIEEKNLFHGIYHGIKNVRWGDGHIHSLVVIGAHGNRPLSKDEPAKEKVVKLLENNNIVFYALNIKHDNVHLETFLEQMRSILRLNGDNGKIMKVNLKGNADRKKISEKAEMLLKDALIFSTNVSEVIRHISERGESIDEMTRKYGVKATQYAHELMKNNGWSKEDLRLTSFKQFCSDGWVSLKSRNGYNQINPFVLIRRDNFDNLVGLLGSIYSRTSRQYNREFDRLIRDACESATGDTIFNGETMANFIQRVFHIPISGLSDVLQYTPQEIKGYFADHKFRERFNKEIGYKWEKLHYIAESKEGNLIWDEKKQRWTKGDSKHRDWWFVTSAGLSFCWLPFEYLP